MERHDNKTDNVRIT